MNHYLPLIEVIFELCITFDGQAIIMPKPLLIFLLLISTYLPAQNWMPFNPNDSIQHFVARDSVVILRSNYNSGPRYIFPINTLSVDTSYADSSSSTLVFKRGFSLVDLRSSLTNSGPWPHPRQKIKGKILGDTMITNQDSTVVKSIDTAGFTLTFPHSIQLNKTWMIGKSSHYIIQATVDSIKFDQVTGYSQDSLAYISLQVFNHQLIPQNHPFSSKVVLAKNLGLVSCIDFTSLNHTNYYELINWGEDSLSYSEYNSSAVGDEVFFRTYGATPVFPGTLGFQYTHEIIVSDTTINSVRTQEIQKSISPGIFPVPNPVFYLDTTFFYIRTLGLQGEKFTRESCIIKFTNPAIPFFPGVDFEQYGIGKSTSPFQLVNLKSENFEVHTFFKDSIAFDEFESNDDSLNWIGLGPWIENTYNLYGSNGIFHYAHEIIYVKVGNISYGNRPQVLTSLPRQNLNQSLAKIFPNPAIDKIKVKTSYQVDLINVLNHKGQLIKKHPFENQIDISQLAPGLYFLKLIGENQTETLKLIKQ